MTNPFKKIPAQHATPKDTVVQTIDGHIYRVVRIRWWNLREWYGWFRAEERCKLVTSRSVLVTETLRAVRDESRRPPSIPAHDAEKVVG